MINYHIIFFVLYAIISAFRPVFFVKFKEYFLFSIFLSLLSMYIGSILYMLYEYKTKKNYKILTKIKDTFKFKNILNSVIAETRFLSKQYSYILLPLTVSVPLSSLSLISITIFDKVINKVKSNIYEYTSIIFLVIGSIIINFDKILNRKTNNISIKKYIIGIISALVAVVLSGYIYITFQKLTYIKKDPGYTMGVESGGSLVLVTIILIILIVFKKVNIPNLKIIIIMFVLLTFLFNIDIIFKFIGFESIPVLFSVFLSQFSVLITFLIGIFYFKEKVTKFKILGLIIIILASVSGILLAEKSILKKFKLDKLNDKIINKIKSIFRIKNNKLKSESSKSKNKNIESETESNES